MGGDEETAFRYKESDTMGIFYWQDEKTAYALAGPLERERLLTVAKAVYTQLERF